MPRLDDPNPNPFAFSNPGTSMPVQEWLLFGDQTTVEEQRAVALASEDAAKQQAFDDYLLESQGGSIGADASERARAFNEGTHFTGDFWSDIGATFEYMFSQPEAAIRTAQVGVKEAGREAGETVGGAVAAGLEGAGAGLAKGLGLNGNGNGKTSPWLIAALAIGAVVLFK